MKFVAVFFAVLIALPAHAEEPSVSRRDAFMLIWESIRRPAEETREAPYVDVPEGDEGFLEITYAKRRGILDDDSDAFRPHDPLVMDDAVLWLFRTRNIDDPALLTPENVPTYLKKYPIVDASQLGEGVLLSRENLVHLIGLFDQKLRDEVHEASLYAEKFHGKGTAFGESFDMHALTAAHRTFPHNTLVKVTNVANGKSVTVRINDRGPFVEGRDMDLSLASFLAIEERSRGKLNATFVRLGDVSLQGPEVPAPVAEHDVTPVETGGAITVESNEVPDCAGTSPRYGRIAKELYFTGGLPHVLTMDRRIEVRANRAFVVRFVTYPDGLKKRVQDFILPDESYGFTPSMEGTYVLRIESPTGRGRDYPIRVVACASRGS